MVSGEEYVAEVTAQQQAVLTDSHSSPPLSLGLQHTRQFVSVDMKR